MKWGIIGALDKEVENIKNALQNKTEYSFGMLNYTCGNIGNQEVVVTGCSIGTVNAAACTQMMIAKFDVNCIVNTGIAGAMDKRLKVMDVVVSSSVMFHDTAQDIYKKFSPFRVEFDADPKLIVAVTEAIKVIGGITCYTGKIATGNAFVTDSALKQSIINYCEPMCVEMEGAAVAQVAYLNNLPFLVLRTMSDNADDDGEQTYDNFFEEAAEHSAKIVISMIKNSI
ncbi:MAG: 5'-methylthioadenosine/adenosylhomocysteine nucleosidase [Oscillospiraceae bacterium]